MEPELIKSIVMTAIEWLFGYGVNCLLALPDGTHNESDYIPLPKPIAYILFLPLAIGRCRSYMILAIFMQAALFLFIPAVALAEYLAHIGVIAEDKIETYFQIAFCALVAIGLLAHLIRWLLMERPKRYKPRRRARKLRSRRRRRRR